MSLTRDLHPMLTEGSLLEATLHVWQELMRHDELLSARRFIESCVPWRVRHRAEIAEAKKTSADATAHLASEGAYSRYYAEHAITTHSLPLGEVDPRLSQAPRWDFVRSVVEAEARQLGRPARVIDLGCQDGWMTWRLAEMEQAVERVTGVEMLSSLVNLAGQRECTSELRARISFIRDSVPLGEVPPGPWDVVVCCELWEHVRSEEALYADLLRLAQPGAVVVLTTPHGSWYGGLPLSYAPPWYAMRDHVRTATLPELVARFQADFAVECAAAVPIPLPEVLGQATACLVVRRRQCAP